MGQEFNSKHLSTYGEAADRNVFALLHIAQSTGDDLLGGVISIIIADGIIVNGGIEEFSQHPSGADRHNADTSSRALQLTVQRAAEGEYERLRCAIHVDKGYGLE